MAITEHSRKQLYEGLEGVLGEERATTLMEHLPPVGWADVATKQDVEHVRTSLSADIENLRVETKKDIQQLRVDTKKDIQQLRVDTKKDIQQLRVDTENLWVSTQKDIEHVRTCLTAEMVHTREVTERRFVEIDRRFDSLGEIFATKYEVAQLRSDMFKLITAQTVALVIAMSTIVSRFAG